MRFEIETESGSMYRINTETKVFIRNGLPMIFDGFRFYTEFWEYRIYGALSHYVTDVNEAVGKYLYIYSLKPDGPKLHSTQIVSVTILPDSD